MHYYTWLYMVNKMKSHSSVVSKYYIRLCNYKWGSLSCFIPICANKYIVTQSKEQQKHETILNNVQFHNSCVNRILWSWTDQRIVWRNYAIKSKKDSDRGKGGKKSKNGHKVSNWRCDWKIKWIICCYRYATLYPSYCIMYTCIVYYFK